MKNLYLSITVDVEAQPARATSDHVGRLIWGRHDGREIGVREILRRSARHGYEATCFLDLAELELHGAEIADVGRAILADGHDLQVHCHPEFLSAEFFRRRGISRPAGMNDVDERQADLIVDWLDEQYQAISSGNRPSAFRGGGYRYNHALLRKLHRNGYQVSSNYNPTRPEQVDQFGPRLPFTWSDGLLEVPISSVPQGDKYCMSNFNLKRLFGMDRFRRHVDALVDAPGPFAHLVLVMHSWSFLELDEHGHYQFVGDALMNHFDDAMSYLRASGWHNLPMRLASPNTYGIPLDQVTPTARQTS